MSWTKKIKYFTITDWCPFRFHIRPSSRYQVKTSFKYSIVILNWRNHAFYIGLWFLSICPLSHYQHFLKVLLKLTSNLWINFLTIKQTLAVTHPPCRRLIQELIGWRKFGLFWHIVVMIYEIPTKARFSRPSFLLRSFHILILTCYDSSISQNIQIRVIITPKHMLTKEHPTRLSCSQKNACCRTRCTPNFQQKEGWPRGHFCLSTAILPLYVSMCLWMMCRCLFIILRW